jgi:hypothetical protein
MNTNDTTLLEVLKLARDLVVNEHTDRRAHIHNQWVFDSEFLLKTKRVRLQYPPIPPYPTEAHIIERAQSLMDFLNNNKVAAISAATNPAMDAAETIKIEDSVAPSPLAMQEYQYSPLLATDTESQMLQPTEMLSTTEAVPTDADMENTSSVVHTSNVALTTIPNFLIPTLSMIDPAVAVAKMIQSTQPIPDVVESPLPLVDTAVTDTTLPQVPTVEPAVTAAFIPETSVVNPVAAIAKIFQSTQSVPEMPATIASPAPVGSQAAIAAIFQTPATVVVSPPQPILTKTTGDIQDIFSPSTVVRPPDRLPEQTLPQTTTDNDTQLPLTTDNIIPIPDSANAYNNNNVAELLKQQSEKSSKLLPAMLKKIEDIRNGWNTNTNAS